MSSYDVSNGSSARPGSPRFLIVGCGGIGGVVAAHLFEQGHDVTALTTNPLIADAVNAHGFRVRGEGSPGTVRGRVAQKLLQGTRPFDYVLLATQPPQVEEAAKTALPFLAPTGAMVCFQNGLCEERIAEIAGPDRVLGGVVAWGASMVEPGLYDRTSSGGFVLGRMDGAPDARLEELSRALEAIGPTTVTNNLAGARWSKLAINCAITSLGAIGGDRLGVLMRHRFIRRLALEIMSEVVFVARAASVRLEKVSGTLDLDWIALTDAERIAVGSPGLVAKHALLLAVGARFRRLRSSMLAAIERGRPAAVDFLNGEVTSRGQKLGVQTPINAAIQAEVHLVAQRKARPSLELARALYDRTRAIVNGPHSMPPPSGEGEPDPAALDPEVPEEPREAGSSESQPSL
ncbi:ketopantoate reductase family protein [Polyangium aurulentum]|uniref:ketopantoate reductase family protein n=1 Tax=Polyangium aurulentum TaxID=2567896 RepID=UPI0010AE16CA|nr:ketopantoate reductase family protein [Polyangium aurulentum]UQA61161.1 ketopantoate reductase family protein [Polyangium aurulentum]